MADSREFDIFSHLVEAGEAPGEYLWSAAARLHWRSGPGSWRRWWTGTSTQS
jgi:hypothetical protein